MRSGFSALLIPDECGHRALEETRADWREERARAESAFARGRADMHALSGIARVFAMTAGAGLGRADVWRCFIWTVIAGAVASAAVVLAIDWPRGFAAALTLLLLVPRVMVLVGCGFAAAFGLGLRRSRRMPGLTLCALMLATTAGLGGYVVPKTNAIYYQHIFAQFSDGKSPSARPARPASGNAERNAAGLLRQAMSDERAAARRALLQALAFIVSPVALLLLGAAFRARSSEARAWRLVQVMGGLAASGIFIGAAVACAAIQEALASRPQSLPLWSAIAVSLIVTLWLSRAPSPFRPHRASPKHPST